MKERSCPVSVQEVHAAGLALLSAACAVLCETELCMLPSNATVLLFKLIFSVMPRLCSSIKHHIVVCPGILCVSLEKDSGSGRWEGLEMCVASAGQGHTDSDLGACQSPHSA